MLEVFPIEAVYVSKTVEVFTGKLSGKASKVSGNVCWGKWKALEYAENRVYGDGISFRKCFQ